MNRLTRVNQLLKKEIAEIMLKELNLEQGLTTLTRVECSKDLKKADVFISVIPEKEFKSALDYLNRQIYHIQKLLNKKLKMKNVPKIKFVKENLTTKAANIEKILKNLKER